MLYISVGQRTAMVQAVNFGGSKVWWTTTLQPFDLQTSTVPLWKDLEPMFNIFSADSSSILNKSFVLPKRPDLQRAYLVRGPIFLHPRVTESRCLLKTFLKTCRKRSWIIYHFANCFTFMKTLVWKMTTVITVPYSITNTVKL